MAQTVIFDLEGTTGIYNTSGRPHVNNIAFLRPGMRETISDLNSQNVRYALATRAPVEYVRDILTNLRHRGINWKGDVFTRDDVTLADQNLLPYKDLSKVYGALGITDPARETVILGDFLRFAPGQRFSQEDYLGFDFKANPEVLTSNFALNDHPFPEVPEHPTKLA